MVDENEKKRFSLSQDGTRIRARQGHSIKVDLGMHPLEPPTVLYHGTATRFLNAIRAEGLTSQGRHHVHLSKDQATALSVGQRHGTPVILTVDAKQMCADNFLFFRSENGVWLTDHVPAQYLSE